MLYITGTKNSVVIVATRSPPITARPSGLSPAFTIAGGVLTLVGGGLTTFFALDTVKKKDEFLSDQTQPKLDEAFASQTRTNIALGVTIGLAVVTGVVALVLTDWTGAKEEKASARRMLSGVRF